MTDKLTADTGGGAYVGKDIGTGGGNFTGRDEKRADSQITNNFNFDDHPRNSIQPPTLYQTVNQLVEKVDQILDLIQGDDKQDIKGIRPRIREIDKREAFLLWGMVILYIFVIAIALGWHL